MGAQFDKKVRAHQGAFYRVALLAVELRTKGPALAGPLVIRVAK
jgi:hypothetical protein